MLDVHPPHHPLHAWRDFFIHIATIVVGLLIAIGLEQIVEHLHERYQLRETREALHREFESNRSNLADDERDWLTVTARLKNNLLVLEYIRQHPGVPQTELPGDLRWTQSPFQWNHAEWDAAEKNGITRLMPAEEANKDQEFYIIMSSMSQQSLDTWNAINDAARFDLLHPDPTQLSPQQLNEVIQLTNVALEKHILFGYSFGRYAAEFPEMPHRVTWALIEKLRPEPLNLDPKGMAAAHQRTDDRIKTATAPFL